MAEKDVIIEPQKGKKERALPSRALMVVNPSEADFAFKIFAPFGGESRTISQTRLVVDTTHTLCLAGPALGAPAAVLILEKLVVLGVTDVWLVSCCGSLDPSRSIGEVLLGTAAVSGEGVTPYYTGETVVKPGVRATAEIEDFARKQGIDAGCGTIWTTDAPYRERHSELLRLQEQFGVVGVDMEFSALCSVAAWRGISLGALFVVSDMLWTRSWKPGFGGLAFKSAARNVIEKLIRHGVHREL